MERKRRTARSDDPGLRNFLETLSDLLADRIMARVRSQQRETGEVTGAEASREGLGGPPRLPRRARPARAALRSGRPRGKARLTA